jgi:cobalamin biosynthesis protein CobD/CbiB
VLGHYWLEAIERGSWRVLAVMALVAAAIAYFGYRPERQSHLPVLAIGSVLLFVDNRFWRGGQRKLWRVFIGIAVVTLITGTIATTAPLHPLIVLFFLMLATILALNWKFYVFMFQRKGIIFTAAVTPFHLFYHFYSGLAFAFVLTREAFRRLLPL